MPAVAIIGSVDSGHGGFSPATVVSGQPLMTVNGTPVAGTGNMTIIHAKPDTPPHPGVVMGTSKVTVNGVVIAMVGSPTACGAVVVSGNGLMNIT